MSKQGRPEPDRDRERQQGAPPPELNRLDVTMPAGRMAQVAANDKAHIHTIAPVYFQRTRRTLYFYVGNVRVREGDLVLVDVTRGTNWGKVVAAPVRTISDGGEYARIVRVLSRDEEARLAVAEKREAEARGLCRELAGQMGLDMKVVDVEFTTSQSKAIFYFTAEERVDFRELVRELARHLRMTIEMRQIGARDETKILGGMGPCGLETCCSNHLNDFAPVTIKMAKNQDLALNPQKVSGLCGRLFCCLAYEDAVYTELKKGTPKRDGIIRTPDGVGRALEVDIFRRRVKAAISGKDAEWYDLEKIEIGNDGDRQTVLAQEVAAREQREAAIEAQRERMRHFDAMRQRTAEKAQRGDLGDTAARDVSPEADARAAGAPAPEGDRQRRPDRDRDRDRGRERDRGPRRPEPAPQRPAVPADAAPPAADAEGQPLPAATPPEGAQLPAEEATRRRRRRRRRRGPREEGHAQGQGGSEGSGDDPGDSADAGAVDGGDGPDEE